MSILSCDAHGCFVILSRVLLSLSDPSPLSDYWFICPTCHLWYSPLFACLFSVYRVEFCARSCPALSVLDLVTANLGFLLLVCLFYVFVLLNTPHFTQHLSPLIYSPLATVTVKLIIILNLKKVIAKQLT